MLSELLYSSSRVTNIMDEVTGNTLSPKTSKSQVWTGGVGSNIARKNVWFWHNNTDTVKSLIPKKKIQENLPRLWSSKTGGVVGLGELGLTDHLSMSRETKL